MMYFNTKKENCTGCTACMSVCPKKSITMKRDEEGFLYPVASDECIKCGKCEKVCPIVNGKKISTSFSKRAYAALAYNKEVWRSSASGGAFSEICKAYADDHTLICGATWNGLFVEHSCVEGVDSISAFRKSKYVESNLRNCFSELKKHLDADGKAIFSGSPCQVAGLRAFLGKDYEKLLLVDLICHGVGSQEVFLKCMNAIEKQFHGKIEKYEFRAKRKKHESNHIQKRSIASKELYVRNDQYIQLFLNQTCLRPSCGANCRFRDENRQGDITIADFKGLTYVFPDLLGSKYNYSTIVINSAKGNELLGRLYSNMEMRECDIEDIKKYNPLFFRQTIVSEDRKKFFEDFISNPENSIDRWTEPAQIAKESIKRKIYNSLPSIIRRYVMKIIGGAITSEYEGCSLSKIILKEEEKYAI